MVHTKQKKSKKKKIYIQFIVSCISIKLRKSDRRSYYSESPPNQLKINNPTEKWANDRYRKITEQELYTQPY